MKLQAEVNDQLYQVEIREAEGTVTAEIDGRRYEIQASKPEPNVSLLKTDGRIFEAIVSPSLDPGRPYEVRIGTHEIDVHIVDSKRRRSSAGGAAQTDGLIEMKTAMPGKIVRVLKAAGDSVAKGEGVIVVEAMKMQNEMKSPRDGVVKDIKVSEGANVGAGEVLVIIE